jgi:hypothetical protein
MRVLKSLSLKVTVRGSTVNLQASFERCKYLVVVLPVRGRYVGLLTDTRSVITAALN